MSPNPLPQPKKAEGMRAMRKRPEVCAQLPWYIQALKLRTDL